MKTGAPISTQRGSSHRREGGDTRTSVLFNIAYVVGMKDGLTQQGSRHPMRQNPSLSFATNHERRHLHTENQVCHAKLVGVPSSTPLPYSDFEFGFCIRLCKHTHKKGSGRSDRLPLCTSGNRVTLTNQFVKPLPALR